MSYREYIISDTHFNHKKIIDYENRPFETVEEMNETMIKNWNEVVSKGDRIYILGDFAFGNAEYIEGLLKRLKGYKILIMGNHDRRIDKRPSWWIDRGFNEAYSHNIIKNNNLIMQHEPAFDYFTEYGPYFNFYGHIHTKGNIETVTKGSACVCVERWNYTPVLINKILEKSKRI